MAEVQFIDGAWRLPDGRPIRLGGEPVAHFNPGWHATAADPGPGGLTFLHLEHETGAHAIWLLDPNLDHLPADPSAWPQPLRDRLSAEILPALESLRDTLLLTRAPTLAAAAHRFLGWDETLRRNLAALWANEVLHPPQHIHLTPDMGGLEIKNEAGRRLAILPHENLDAALAADLQERFLAAMQSGTLTWPSPFTGQPTPCNRSFCLSDFHFAYRFTDPVSDVDWFVLASDHLCKTLALWFPMLDLLITRDGYQHDHVSSFFPVLSIFITEHLARYGDVLAAAPAQTSFAVPLRGKPGAHLGHLLWNELSAIEPLVEAVPKRRLPEWLVVSADYGTEFYGPIDELYPEIEGCVNRALTDSDALTRYSYRAGVHILRVTREFISQDLRTRIARGLPEIAVQQSSLDQGLSLTIMLGLRVENRTIIDLLKFLVRTIEIIIQLFPNSTIVLDGHNSRSAAQGAGLIESHHQHRAIQSPLEVERCSLGEFALGLPTVQCASKIHSAPRSM